MLTLDFHPTGRHFLQIPGPSPVPDRILRAMSLPTIDHRGPEFGALGLRVLKGIQQIFQTRHPVIIYPASGTGAWEAALGNVLSPGDQVLMYETGHFASLWNKMATRLGLKTEFLGLPGIEGWRRGVQADMIEARLKADTAARHQGGVRGAQRDLDRRHQQHPGRAQGDRCGQASGAADGRQHLGPGLGRVQARRVGRGRHHQRLAEGPDAAPGHQLQRAVAQGDRGQQGRRSCPRPSGPGTRSSR